MITYVLIEGISCVVGYIGVYWSLASLWTHQKCFCLVTDPSEVLLPRYGLLLWIGEGFVIPHGLCRGRSFNDNMVKNPFNEYLQSMHPLLS